MKVEPIVWTDEYNVGNEIIDVAHKKLFSILRQILVDESLDSTKVEATCVETIKYLKKYTVQHFAEEEAYMRKIKYPGYMMHKELHDNIREVALPKLEENLVNTNFSEEAVFCLVSFLSGWLTGHIMIEDRAITGRALSRYNNDHKYSDNHEILDVEFQKFVHDLFRIKSSCSNKYYSGEELKSAHYFEFVFETEDDERINKSVIVFSENRLMTFMMSKIIGVKIDKIDKESLLAYIQVLIYMTKAALAITNPELLLVYKTTKTFNAKEYRQIFHTLEPRYSMKWQTDEGSMGIIIE